MQSKILYTISALIGIAVAQDFSNVPKCAMAPALAAFGKTGCAITNIKCLCESTSLVPDLEAAVAAACTPAELAQVNAFAISTCKSAGVTLVIPGASSGTASGTASATTSGTTTSGTASTTSSSSVSESSTASVTTTTATTGSATTTAVITTGTSSANSESTSVSATGESTTAAGSTTTSVSQSSSSSHSATASAATGAANALQMGGSAIAGAFLFALAL